jgi:hypothetical protein
MQRKQVVCASAARQSGLQFSAWRSILVGVLLVLLVSGGARTVSAQGVNTATLSGTVSDPQNLGVKGAKVTLTNAATGATRTTVTDDNGRYNLVGIPPGRYKMTVDGGANFGVYENGSVVLTVGETASLDPRLELKGMQQTVTVSTETALIEPAKTEVSQTIEQHRIDNLPINGRNYINFTLTNSQTNRDASPSIGAAPTSGLNVGGQRARSNMVSVDGADAVDNSVNGIRATVSQEAVQEFQLILSNYNAEYGRAMGGVINIVTKGGANEPHGNVFGFLRNKAFQARNPFSIQVDPVTGAATPVKQAYTRVQAGATLGGPIVKDKTFYFLSYETTRRQETGFTSIGENNFNFVPATTPVVPGVTLLMTQAQSDFVNNPAVLGAPGGVQLAQQIFALAGSASNVALTGVDPGLVAFGEGVAVAPGPRFPFPIDCGAFNPSVSCSSANLVNLPASFVPLNSLRGNYPIKEGTSLWSGRLDHHWNSNNGSFLRVSVSPSLITGIQVNAQNQNFGQNAGSRTSLQQTRDVSGVFQHDTVLSQSLFNTFRFQYARRGLHYGFSQLPGGSGLGVNIPGFAFFGREPFSTEDRIERRFEWTDNLSWIKGGHIFKAGADINYLQLRSKKAQVFELNYGGVMNFGGLTPSNLTLPSTFNGVTVPGFTDVQAYGLGLPTTFIQGIGNSNRLFNDPLMGFFIQDSWKIHPRLTLNYGVRYDLELTAQFTPATALNATAEKAFNVTEGYPRDYNNVAPRFALAWDLAGNGKTVVRAGYGLFYDHPSFASAFLSTTSDGALSSQLLIFGGTPTRAPMATTPTAANGASIFQGVLNTTGIPGITYLPNEQRFDPTNSPFFNNQNFLSAGFPLALLPFTLPIARTFQYAYAQQGNLTLEHQLGRDYKFSLSYSYTRGLHLNRPRNIDSTDPKLLAQNLRNALAAGISGSNPFGVVAPASNIAATSSTCGVNVIAPQALGVLANCPAAAGLAPLDGQFIGTAAFFNFFKPSGPNPSFAGLLPGGYGSGPCSSPTPFSEIALACAAGYPTGFPGVLVPWASVDQQESSGNSIYHGLTANFSKRFTSHAEFLSSYTWSHAIDDSTDLQTLLEPQDNRFPNKERSNSSFDQRHRWVTSAVFQTPETHSGDGFAKMLFGNFTVSPIVEVSSGRPFTVLTGTDFRLDFSAAGGRPSVGTGGVSSPFIPGKTFVLPDVCLDNSGAPFTVQIPPSPVPIPPAVPLTPPLGCTGNLGRNAFTRPNFFQWDMRVARRFPLSERLKLDVIADMFNLFNRFNVGDVSPLCNPTDPAGCNAGQPTAALDPRQFQFALKLSW